ncbi:hypothetical protein [Allokutzneria sp. NRRL B-24872]|nr:hypothetical protein [Allokutzneria sp. NRRL B-24872]
MEQQGFALDQDTTEKFWAMLDEEGTTRAGFILHLDIGGAE